MQLSEVHVLHSYMLQQLPPLAVATSNALANYTFDNVTLANVAFATLALANVANVTLALAHLSLAMYVLGHVVSKCWVWETCNGRLGGPGKKVTEM